MARTKQTARKWPGGAPPRKHIRPAPARPAEYFRLVSLARASNSQRRQRPVNLIRSSTPSLSERLQIEVERACNAAAAEVGHKFHLLDEANPVVGVVARFADEIYPQHNSLAKLDDLVTVGGFLRSFSPEGKIYDFAGDDVANKLDEAVRSCMEGLSAAERAQLRTDDELAVALAFAFAPELFARFKDYGLFDNLKLSSLATLVTIRTTEPAANVDDGVCSDGEAVPVTTTCSVASTSSAATSSSAPNQAQQLSLRLAGATEMLEIAKAVESEASSGLLPTLSSVRDALIAASDALVNAASLLSAAEAHLRSKGNEDE
jgi:hypothetical protein